MGVAFSTHGRDEKDIQILARKYERKRLLGRRRVRWEVILNGS